MSSLAPYDADPQRSTLVALRRDFHRHPELGFSEHRTSKVVQERLAASGLEVRQLARTGVLATLRGAKPGPTALVRSELDALPIHETSEVAYRSVEDGVMHACGHDGHMAVALLVAERLAATGDEIGGTIQFAFQPAEEITGGARLMIEEGALEDPSVDAVLAVHLWQDLPVGTVGVLSGPAWAAVDDLTLTVHGTSGHGAMPHQAIDAVVVASHIITALQSVVSRTRSPFAPAVLTIGTVHGGAGWNIIADHVEMRGTLRTFDSTVRQHLVSQLTRIAEGIAESMGARCDVVDRYAAPPLVNNPDLVEIVRDAVIPVMGDEHVVAADPAMVGDDFAYFAEARPGCMFLVGSSNMARGLDKPHHNSAFDIDEASLPIAAASLEAVLRRFLTAT